MMTMHVERNPIRAPSIVFPGKTDFRRIVWEREARAVDVERR
jgi:hypothetical protein